MVENQECTLRTLFITGAERGKAGSLKADIMDGRKIENENGGNSSAVSCDLEQLLIAENFLL